MEPIAKRFDLMSVGAALAAIPMIVRVVRLTVEDLDRITEILQKWANMRSKDQPLRRVQILGPDGKVIREIESDQA